MLPNEYWQLEYIQSSGTQYILTGIVSQQLLNCKVNARMSWATLPSDGSFLGYRVDSNTRRYLIYYWNNNWNLGTGGNHNTGGSAVASQIYDVETKLKSGASYLKIDGNLKISSSDELTAYNQNSNSLCIFALNSNGTVDTYSSARCYYLKIYVGDNDDLVRDFVPCKRKSDNAVGLYDLVNDQFYTNSGSGTFTHGAIIDAPLNITFEDNPLTVYVSQDNHFIAEMLPSYDITLVYDNTLGSAEYSWVGTSLSLVATPNSNAQFKGWYINSTQISTSATTTYTPYQDTTIEARFERVWDITESVDGDGSISYTRGVDKNDVVFNVIPNANRHFVKYSVNGTEYINTPLNLHLTENIVVVAYFEEDDKFHITASTDFPNGSIYVSDNDVYSGTVVTLWARPFPDYNFVKWGDGTFDNPKSITVTENVTIVAEYQRTLESNGIYQYRCFVKDQLDMEATPKSFMVVDTFDVRRDTMTKATASVTVLEMPTNINDGDVLVVYDPKGTPLYNGVINSISDRTIRCSQMPSFYKGKWIYNVSPQDYLEHEIAVLLQNYADGRMYGSSWVDPQVAQRLGGITIDYIGSTSVNLPTDLDDNNNPKYTQKDMEEFIYELYEKYNIIFDFEINISGPNYVHIKVPNYDPLKVGNNMYAIQDMSPVTTIEETNRLIIYGSDKSYRATYIATKNNIVKEPLSTANRFDITNTAIVFSDDPEADLVANNLPETMYNHKLTFKLIVKNFIYQFGDFKLGGQLDIYHNDDYYNSVLTGYQIKKSSNRNITEVAFTCGKVRNSLTNKLTLRRVL